MGKQMVGILRVLRDLKNPESRHGYFEADYGIDQTEIILRAEKIEPYKEKRRWGRDRFIKPVEEGRLLVAKLEGEGKNVEMVDAGENLVIDSYEGEYEYCPPQMRVASALMGKKIGQNASPYNFIGRCMAVDMSLKHPEMKNDPVIKCHFDFVENLYEGRRRADKIYASYSRSLKLLLKTGLISSNWYIKTTGEKIRHHRARYLITEDGRNYIADLKVKLSTSPPSSSVVESDEGLLSKP